MKDKDDEINTNAEYVNEKELDDIVDKEGEPIDPIEQNQDPVETEEDGSPKKELHEAIQGDENDPDNLFNE